MNAPGEDQRVPSRLAGATLAVWSGLFCTFYFSGRLNAFLAPSFRPGVLIAGAMLALMALALLIAGGNLHACGDVECAHPGGSFRMARQSAVWLLIAPLLLALFAGDGSFSASAVSNRTEISDVRELRGKSAPLPQPASATSATAFAEPPLPAQSGAPEPQLFTEPPAEVGDYLIRTPEGHIKVEVLDLLYASQDAGLRKDFAGKSVELIGQFLPAKSQNPRGNRFKATRLFMMCCAADARPVSTLIETEKIPKWPEMTWLKITGTATFPITGGKCTPVLKATKIEKIRPPDERMLY